MPLWDICFKNVNCFRGTPILSLLIFTELWISATRGCDTVLFDSNNRGNICQPMTWSYWNLHFSFFFGIFYWVHTGANEEILKKNLKWKSTQKMKNVWNILRKVLKFCHAYICVPATVAQFWAIWAIWWMWAWSDRVASNFVMSVNSVPSAPLLRFCLWIVNQRPAVSPA